MKSLLNEPYNNINHFTTGDGCRIAYQLDGASDKPVLVLGNSIATTLNMWDRQVSELSKYFRILRYDYRGHGSSDATEGAYSIDRLGRDVIELLDELNIYQVHFCGLSLGGMVGQWLGIHHPERIDRLILCNTSSYLGPANQWDEFIATTLKSKDLSNFADMFMRNWFPPYMLESENETVSTFHNMVLGTQPKGLAGCWSAVRDMDMRRTVALISRPTLVVAGQNDTVTLPSHGERIAKTVPNSKLIILPVVHLSNVELPDEFQHAIIDFLRSK